MDVVFATMLIGLRRRSGWLIGHKEWAPPRKIDPADGKGGLDMKDCRALVRKQIRVLAHGKSQPSPGAKGTHVVQSGDTLFAIALKHHMSVAELQKLNGLQTDLIRVGDKLKVRS